MFRNNLKKISVLFLFTSLFLLGSCSDEHSTQPDFDLRHDVKYKIEFEGDERMLNFVELNIEKEGIINKGEIYHDLNVTFSESLNIDNLKITCNEKPIEFSKSISTDYGGKYKGYQIYSEVKNDGINDLNYKIDLSDCDFNYYDVKLDSDSITNLSEFKYYVEYDPNLYSYESRPIVSLNSRKFTFLDIPENKIIKQPVGTDLFIFAPKQLGVKELYFNFVDKVNDNSQITINMTTNNAKTYDEPYYISDNSGKQYHVFRLSNTFNDGTISKYCPTIEDIYETPSRFDRFENAFNIVTLETRTQSFSSQDMLVDETALLEIDQENESLLPDAIKYFYDEDGTTKTLYDAYNGGTLVSYNNVDYNFNPMFIRDPDNPNDNSFVYDSYFVYNLGPKSTLNKTNIEGISFELYDDDLSSGPKLTIPNSDVHLCKSEYEDEYLVIKITPEMIKPYIKECKKYEGEKVTYYKSGHLFLVPKFDNLDKFVQLEINPHEIKSEEHIGEKESELFRINTITNVQDPNHREELNGVCVLNENKETVLLLDKSIIDYLEMDYVIESDLYGEFNEYATIRIDQVKLNLGSVRTITEDFNSSEHSKKGTIPFKDLFINDKLKLEVVFKYNRNYESVKLDLTNMVSNDNFDLYYSTYLNYSFDTYEKLTSENVDELNIILKPRSFNYYENFYYYVVPKNEEFKKLDWIGFNFNIDIDGEETSMFSSTDLMDIFNDNINYKDHYIHYVETKNSMLINYKSGLVAKASFNEM